jgi:hypothetical protein
MLQNFLPVRQAGQGSVIKKNGVFEENDGFFKEAKKEDSADN